jgi:hypothetical protein
MGKQKTEPKGKIISLSENAVPKRVEIDSINLIYDEDGDQDVLIIKGRTQGIENSDSGETPKKLRRFSLDICLNENLIF